MRAPQRRISSLLHNRPSASCGPRGLGPGLLGASGRPTTFSCLQMCVNPRKVNVSGFPSPSVATPKPAMYGHLKTGHMKRRPDRVFYSFRHQRCNRRFDDRLECDRPERRIGQRWEATRAPTQGPRPKRGVGRCPVLFLSFGIGRKRKIQSREVALPYFSGCSSPGSCVLVRQLRGPHFKTWP